MKRIHRTCSAAAAIALWSWGTPAAWADTSTPDIAVGYSHTCARRTNGTLWCWGSNDSGQIGDGTTVDRRSPVPVAALGAAVAEVVASDLFTCARKVDGTLWCWGNNASGQLGDGTTFDSLVPIQVVALGESVAEVSAGDAFVCARKVDGSLWCWGAGFLGNGTSAGSLVPIAITALGSSVAEISTGDAAACARKTDNTVWCWGDNTFGVVGDGTNTTRLVPTPVNGLGSSVAGVSLGDLFACARKVDGTLWCWGNNDKGELGDGSTAGHLAPVQVASLGASVAQVSANGRHACARVTDGGLRCWGWNVFGELGDGTSTDRLLPVAVAGFGSTIVEVSAGINHETCARSAAGSVYCAGNNDSGQIGDGTTINRSTPVQVISETPAVPATNRGLLALLATLLLALALASLRRSLAIGALACWALVGLGCDGADIAGPPATMAEELGSMSFALDIGPNVHILSVGYAISGPAGFMRTGSFDVSHSATVSGLIDGLPPGAGYALSLTASDVAHKLTGCSGSAAFDVTAGLTTPVPVHLICFEAPAPLAVPLSRWATMALAIALAAAGIARLRRHRTGSLPR